MYGFKDSDFDLSSDGIKTDPGLCFFSFIMERVDSYKIDVW